MEIYVVSSCWWRDGATVIGAAVSREDAERIADRAETDDHRLASWAPWKEVSPAEEDSRMWHRDALMADGTTHASLYQEIVQLPLAGMGEVAAHRLSPDTLALLERDRVNYAAEISEIGRQFGAP